jgi:hydrogenase expression/formation protein HypD
MRFVDEYRDAGHGAALAYEAIARLVTRAWTLMEVCGGQTHAIVRYGLDRAAADRQVTLVHGPGCPVCVTPVEIARSPRWPRAAAPR